MTINQAQEWIVNSPRDPGKIAEGHAGWMARDKDGNWFLCSTCAGRLAKRGCLAGHSMDAVWSDQKIDGLCCQVCARIAS